MFWPDCHFTQSTEIVIQVIGAARLMIGLLMSRDLG
jgi:hypothetical protein